MSQRILVVDDDVDEVDQTCRLLEGAGYQIARAYDGRQALQTLIDDHDQEPCVVLLDLNMPVMDGWQLLALMRSYSRLARIPVVLFTAQEVPERERAAFEDILRKPVPPDRLMETVRRVCATGRTVGGR